MNYIDGVILAVPKANKEKFTEHALKFDQAFIEWGALRVVECWEDDVPDGKQTDFRRAVQAQPDEDIVFSWVEWPDKATRDAGMEKMQAAMETDTRVSMEHNPMPFDGMRLIYGGFKPIIQLNQ
ncbi:hypothetical protein tinsulaeT_24180 [Thalassotalea insulae]|uniref:DUF1428 domain-containing protein n=1 Tax=Thalassotalea insulae TaxID=2056778 RepID=A0ABQ6GT22_9GAMM|nr:DUF1428 domain-containing protein [Thalassotalea insulae]GLX79078.1 hypothetical protein tinsulaeT_24180 [Thalassotalea insulae]